MMFDLDKIPTKYLFSEQKLTENKYIDDNALGVYKLLVRGFFSTSNTEMDFLFFRPFEWSYLDFRAFLIWVSKEYSLKIENIKTNFCAIKDDYEVSFFENGVPVLKYQKIITEAVLKHKDKTKPLQLPRMYEGAYQKFLDQQENGPEIEELELFNKFYNDTATASDLERLLIYADRVILGGDEYKQESKEMFGKILDWTTFSIELSPEQRGKLKKDIDTYLEAFANDSLTRDSKQKRIRDTRINQSMNVFKFKKHSTLFREYLQKMYDDFGPVTTIENTFEERFPNDDDIDGEYLRKRYSERNFLFLHTLFSFERQGLIKILYLGNNWDYHEENFLTYQAKIEILPSFFNEDTTKKLYFDTDKSRFYIQGKEIKLQKFKDEYHTLRIIFEDPKEIGKEWFFSEIAERNDRAKINDKKYYNAIYQLKLKLSKQGINDCFISTRQSTKINQKYLS